MCILQIIGFLFIIFCFHIILILFQTGICKPFTSISKKEILKDDEKSIYYLKIRKEVFDKIITKVNENYHQGKSSCDITIIDSLETQMYLDIKIMLKSDGFKICNFTHSWFNIKWKNDNKHLKSYIPKIKNYCKNCGAPKENEICIYCST